jgi:hypothetical protein
MDRAEGSSLISEEGDRQLMAERGEKKKSPAFAGLFFCDCYLLAVLSRQVLFVEEHEVADEEATVMSPRAVIV